MATPVPAVLPLRTPNWDSLDFSTADVYTASVGESAMSAVTAGKNMLLPGRRVVVKLREGASYNEIIQTPTHGISGGWISVTKTGLLPVGRVTRTLAQSYGFPQITASDDFDNTIKFSPGCRGWRFQGLEITSSHTETTASLIRTGFDNGSFSRISDLPQRLSFRQLWVHGWGAHQSRIRGFNLNGSWIEIVDSWLDYINYGGVSYSPQCQSLAQDSGLGVLRIENNFLWGCLETVAFGGGGQYGGQFTAEQCLVSDITFRRNHLYRPLSVRGDGSQPTDEGCANGVEFKLGRRILIEANVFENCWYNLQAGYSTSTWSVNQFGPEYYVQTCDVTVRNNWFKNFNSGVALTGSYAVGGPNPPPPRRMTFYNNLWTGMGTAITTRPFDGVTNAVGVIMGPMQGDVWYHHNTCISASGPFNTFEPQTYSKIFFEDNIIGAGPGWNFIFCAIGSGDTAWATINANGDCEHRRNVCLSTAFSIPNGGIPNLATQYWVGDISEIGFIDSSLVFSNTVKAANLGGLALAPTSSFKGIGPGGTDPGCDISSLTTALVGVEAGASDLPP